MSIDIIPVKPEGILSKLDDLANQLSFINTAIIAMCERKYSDIGSDELMGLQCILFNMEANIRGVDNCLRANQHLLMPQQAGHLQTPKEAVDAYLTREQ